MTAPMGPSGMPPYVEHGGDLSTRHPAYALSIRMYAFTLKVSRPQIDAYCQRMFNEPSGGREHWCSISDVALVTFVDSPTMGSGDPAERWLGVVAEQESAIWMPVADVRRGRMAWAIPYIFVDNDLALVGGRETYGFPKQIGTFVLPRTGFVPTELQVSALSQRTYGREHMERINEVIGVTNRGIGDKTELARQWSTPIEMMRDLAKLMIDPDRAAGHPSPGTTLGRKLGADLLSVLRHPFRDIDRAVGEAAAAMLLANNLSQASVPMVLLKQFRDTQFTTSACYQAVVEVANDVTAFAGGGLLPAGFEVQIADLASEPIIRELGVRGTPQNPGVAFWLEFDFFVHLGQVLFEARTNPVRP